jgi:hypothetical protein
MQAAQVYRVAKFKPNKKNHCRKITLSPTKTEKNSNSDPPPPPSPVATQAHTGKTYACESQNEIM